MADDTPAPAVAAAPLAPTRVPLPAALPAPAIPHDTPPDMAPIAARFAAFSVKPYRAGILNKANVQAPDGRLFPRHDWTPWYVEHIGPLLMFWPAPTSADPDAITATKAVTAPNFINIADADVQLVPDQTAFALNTAGCNLYHLQAADSDDLAQWVASIRLACFEFAKLHEQYTAALLVRPPFRAPAALALIGSDKFAAAVQVRYSGCAEWRKLWCVVYPADQPPPPPPSSRTSILKRKSLALSASSSLASLADPGPQIILYDSKKLKRAVLTLTNIYQAYAVYPERPHLINLSMLGKLEGTVTDHDPNPNSPITHPAFCLVMTSAPDDLAAFLVATCAAFRLYDVAPARSMGGVPVPPNLRVAPAADESSLFLTSEDTQGLDLATNHLQAKALLERTLAAKLAGANAPKTPPEVPPTPRSAGAGGKSRAEKVASVAVAAGGAAAAMAGKTGGKGKGKGKQLPPPPASSEEEESGSESASESGSETGSEDESGSGEEGTGSEEESEETGSESESGSEEEESDVEHTTTDDHGVTTGTDHSGSEAETTDSEEESDAESDASDHAHVKPRKNKTKDLDSVTRGVGKLSVHDESHDETTGSEDESGSDEQSGSDDEHSGSESASGSGSDDDDDATTTSGSDVTDSDDHDSTSSEESTDSDASDSDSDVSDGPITNGAARGGPMPQFDPNAVDFMAGLNANRYAASVATSDSGKPPVPEFAPNSLLSNPHAAGTNKSGPGADEPLVPAFVQFGGLLAKPKATLLQQHQEVQKRQQYYAQLQEHHQQQQLEQAVQREQQYSVMARPRGPLLSVAPRQDATANAAGLLSVVSSREKTRQQQKYAYSGFASGSGVAELVERGAGTGKQIALDFERDRDRQMALESRQLAKEMAEERQRLEEMMAVQRLQQQQAQLQQQQQQQQAQQQAAQQAAAQQAQQQQMGMWGASPAGASPHTMSMYGAPAGMAAMGAMGGMGMMQGGMQGMQGMAAMNRGMATPGMTAMNPYAGMMGHPASMMGPSVPPQAAATALSSDSDASSGSDEDDDSDASATGSEGTGSDSDATGSESGSGSETGTDDEDDASGSGSGSGTESEEEESEEEEAPAPVVVAKGKGKGKAKSKDRSLPSPTAASTPMGMMAAPGYYPMAGGFNPALYQQQMQQMQQMQMMQQMYAGMAGMAAGAQGAAPGQPQQAGAWPGMPYGMMPMMPMMPMMQAPAQQPAAAAKGKSKGKKSKK